MTNLSPHFAKGRRVVMDGVLYQVFTYTRDKVVLVPVEVSGYVKVVKPMYMSNRNNNRKQGT
jgi:RNase P/RNase MRP subunit POP5